MRRKKQMLPLLLAACLVVGMLPTTAFATEGTQDSGITIDAGGLCEHHTSHDDTCGYVAGKEETPCNHEHAEDCYEENTSCLHEHDEGCGYAAANEETPCEYVCEECTVQGEDVSNGTDTAVAYADSVVAVITSGGETTNYATFTDALAAWDDGATLTLQNDVTHGETININDKTVTLDLNGYTLDMSSAATAIEVDSSARLTICDNSENGVLKGNINSVVVYGELNLVSGNLVGRIYVTGRSIFMGGIVNMTGGSVTDDVTAVEVDVDGVFNISGGELSGRNGIWSNGTVTISGSPTITGMDKGNNRGAALFSSGTMTISGTPTLTGGSIGELFASSPITLNTQPASGTTWSIYMEKNDITKYNGVSVIPGEGVTLDASRFISKVDSYEMKANAKGELVLCNHTGKGVAKSNNDGTHDVYCFCGSTVVIDNEACSGGAATCDSATNCELCGEVNATNHIGGTEVRGKVDATTTAEGYTGDTYCKGCGTKIATGTTIPKKDSGGGSGGNSGNTTPPPSNQPATSTSSGISLMVNGVDIPTGGNPTANTTLLEMINNITGERDTMHLTLSHDGASGFQLYLNIDVGLESAGYWASLYFYNIERNAQEFMAAAQIDSKGRVVLPFAHASRYAVVIDTASHAPTGPAGGEQSYVVYTVQKGDTLWKLSRKYDCTVAEIVALNGELIDDPALIFSGWELKIPQN